MGRPLYFEELLLTLRSTSSTTSRDFEQNLYYELEQAKPKFFQLFDIPPRNAQEKKDIEAGIAKLPGRTSISHFNTSFKNEALFLAQELDASELYCAELIEDVAVIDKFGRSATAESAVARLHDEREYLLASLRYIFETAMNPTTLSPRLTNILQRYAVELITTDIPLGSNGEKGRLSEKILLEIDRLRAQMDKIRASLVNAPSTTNATSFGDSTLQMRLQRVQYERRQLGHLLFIFASAREMNRVSVIKMIKWLAAADKTDDLVYYLLTAVLAALDPSPDVENSPDQPSGLMSDGELMVQISSVLDKTAWRVPGLKAIVSLQWSLWVLEVWRVDPNIRGNARGMEEDVEKIFMSGVKGDAFKFLTELVVLSKGPVDDTEDLVAQYNINDERVDVMDADFRTYFLLQLDALVQSIVLNMSSVLRRIRTREEDVNEAAARAMRLSTTALAPEATARHDTRDLFLLIAVIFAELGPEAGLKYWRDDADYDGRLNAFLQWATEVKQVELTGALYDMLASLARGPQCALQAYSFLATGGGQYGMGSSYGLNSCSWNALFNALWSTSEVLMKGRNPASSVPGSSLPLGRSALSTSAAPPGALPPGEVNLLRSFLRLLRNVVRYSIPARDVIRDQHEFRALQTLFSIASFPVALELKASLYDTLAAFCGSEGSVKDMETIHTMWRLMEQSEIMRPPGGVITELEQIETPHKIYPASISLLNLLNSLIHCPKRQYVGGSIQSSSVAVSSIPDVSGPQSRPFDVTPYVTFIIDSVILKVNDRGFRNISDRYRMLDGAVHFLERCLASYDLGPLRLLDLSPGASPAAVQGPLTALINHPGYVVLDRLLVNDSPLRRLLFGYISDGYEAIEKGIVKTHYVNRVIRRILQIVHRVLEIQGPFVEVLLPYLTQKPNTIAIGAFHIPRGISTLDQYLIWSPELIPQIGMYVNRIEDQEMMLLAVNILSQISESPVFNVVDSSIPGVSRRMNRLVVLLDRHHLTPAIIDGFVRLLNLDPEATAISLENSNDASESALDLSDMLRSAVMQLLLHNTTPGKNGPNIAHLLLGFPLRVPQSEMSISDPEAIGGSLSCLHTVIELVNVGIPRLETSGDPNTSRGDGGFRPLFERNPVFAEQCYRLLYQLCVHDFTCNPTVRYLRTREDFFARHLAALPAKALPFPGVKAGSVVYSNQGKVPSTREALTAFLRLRAALLECVALELHVLAENKQGQRISQLLELLFDTSSSNVLRAYSSASGFDNGGALIRVLEILESLDFEWVDGVKPQRIDLQLYGGIPFESCKEPNEDGCYVFSVPLIAGLVASVRQGLLRQGGSLSDQQHRRLEAESKFVLETCVTENNSRLIEHARQVSFVAWRHVLDISLHECFGRLPRGQREHITLDILQAIPAYLVRANPNSAIATLLAELVLSLSTKLREDRHQQLIVQSTVDDTFAASLPVDRVQAIFRTLVLCITASGTSERFRGNLYAALTNFIHLVTTDATSSKTSPSDRDSARSFGASFLGDESFRDPLSLSMAAPRAPSARRSALESGTLAILGQFVEKLVPVICRDAADGSEVWKTVAFTCLDALVQLSRAEKAHKVLNVMARDGYLKNFVHSLKSGDQDLISTLKPDPDNLNPLYVFEAKMALLIRVAQTRQGAERLLDTRIFNLLTHCEFMDARPQNDHAFLDFDSFLPSAIERYHHILIPLLQLCVSILSAAGSASVVSKQALDFVLGHRRTILALLSEHWDQLTLAMLRELQLLVALCSQVIPAVDDLLIPTGFGAIHTAVLSLSARCMSPRRWRDSVVPANETEAQESQTPARGYGKDPSTTVMQEKTELASSNLEKWLAIYSVAITERKGEFNPVVAAVTTLSAEGESSSHIRNPVPTISDLTFALTTVLGKFMAAHDRARSVASRLESPDHISVEEISEITEAAYPEFLDELDMNQRRVLAVRELDIISARSYQEILGLLHWLEVLLLLMWRHLNFFLSDNAHVISSQGGSSLHDARSRPPLWATLSSTNAPRRDLRGSCAGDVLPVLEQLDDIDLDMIGSDSGSRKTFIQLVVRRLREVLSPLDTM